jgi:hypothetical protein
MRVLAMFLVLALAGAARADDEPPVGWSAGVGFGLALVPMAVGGGIAALNDDPGVRRAAMHTFTVGLAVAPIVSHLIAKEWTRAAIFGAVPLAAAALAIGLLEGSRPDDLLGEGANAPRVTYGAALAVEIVATGVGLIDSLMAGERARKKKRSIALVPSVGPSRVGLTLGGSL